KSALADLKKLDASIADRIIKKAETAEKMPEHFLERLVGVPYFKLRCGDYRLFVDWDKKKEKLGVLRVLHRKNAYDKR
ncbi:MAG: type II toxin-antitoxin system RelE/ParE family toxin, partial [Candidatus Micrarchaeota archaeon]|nr:type II toxin-antitoxin system RelE/ParE family toxin [Candidatus Micrarchaeota archaeon]